jgi:hypothetical protein
MSRDIALTPQERPVDRHDPKHFTAAEDFIRVPSVYIQKGFCPSPLKMPALTRDMMPLVTVGAAPNLRPSPRR